MLMIMNFVVPDAAVPVEAGKEVRLLKDLPPSKKKKLHRCFAVGALEGEDGGTGEADPLQENATMPGRQLTSRVASRMSKAVITWQKIQEIMYFRFCVCHQADSINQWTSSTNDGTRCTDTFRQTI